MAPSFSRQHRKKGRGLISSVLNKAIDLLPVELHLPTYSYCGPGTKLKQRLARGEKGINPLDSACKDHDIAYSNFGDSKRRAEADRVLEEKAWQRFKAPDSSIAEKAASWLVTTAMKAKSKFGGSVKPLKKKNKKNQSSNNMKALLKKLHGAGLYLRPYPKTGGGSLKKRVKKKKKNSKKK